jgi:hypothetical protein
MSQSREFGNVDPVSESGDAKLRAQVEAAIGQAARRALRVAKQTGTPVIVWENEQVRNLSWDRFDELTLKIKDR